MKNYVVKAIIDFNDVEEKTEMGTDTPRQRNISVWNCTKERYEYLKNHNAVELVGIDKIEETKIEEKPKSNKKKKSSKK